MTPAKLVAAVEKCGGTVKITHDKVTVESGKKPLPRALLDEFKRSEAVLIEWAAERLDAEMDKEHEAAAPAPAPSEPPRPMSREETYIGSYLRNSKGPGRLF